MTRDGRPAALVARVARWRVPLGFAMGGVSLWFARPTWTSLAIGGAVALMGEAIRVWAAGHLEKSREVTRSGPYRWMRHPLYVGSAVMGAGVAIAAMDPTVAAIAALYLGVSLTAAIRHEDAWLADRFGAEYRAYRDRSAAPVLRAFSMRRAVTTNREYRAAVGLVIAAGLLVIKASFT